MVVGSYIGASSCRAAVTIDNLILVVTQSGVKSYKCGLWYAHYAYEYHL